MRPLKGDASKVHRGAIVECQLIFRPGFVHNVIYYVITDLGMVSSQPDGGDAAELTWPDCALGSRNRRWRPLNLDFPLRLPKAVRDLA